MRITSLDLQKKNSKRYNIFLDGQFGFGADEDSVVKFRLVPGKEINQEDLDKILLETEVGKLIGRMNRWFGIRMRSEKEVRDKLQEISYKKQKKGHEPISLLVVDTLVENLKQKVLLDDEKFARDWVESRSRKKGIRVIKMELYQKGISRETIEKVTRDKLQIKNEEKIAEELLEKKAKVWRNLEKQKFKQKGIEFLMRKGFEYSVAKEVVEKFITKE